MIFPFFDPYPNIWYNIFQNTYADSPNITKMEEFNDQQVQLFNNGGTNPNLLFKISWKYKIGSINN